MDENEKDSYSQYLQNNYQNIILVEDDMKLVEQNFQLVYFFIQLPNFGYNYVNLDDLQSREFMYQNFIQFIKIINNIYSITHEEATGELDLTNKLLFISFFVIMSIALVVILTSLPIYALI